MILERIESSAIQLGYPWRGPRDISLPETSTKERMAGTMGKVDMEEISF